MPDGGEVHLLCTFHDATRVSSGRQETRMRQGPALVFIPSSLHQDRTQRTHQSVSNFYMSPQPLSICRRTRCLVKPWPLAWRGGALDVVGVSPWFPVSLIIPLLLLPRTFWPAHFHFNPRRPRPIHARCSSIHARTLQVSSTTPAAPTSKVAKQAPAPSAS